jgi:hypothetical protein
VEKTRVGGGVDLRDRDRDDDDAIIDTRDDAVEHDDRRRGWIRH